jgi:hypothetical protein
MAVQVLGMDCSDGLPLDENFMTLTTVASILSPPLPLVAAVTVSNPDNAASGVVPAKTLDFQLVQSEIDLTWSLLNLADWLTADSKCLDADRVIVRAKRALLKAETYAGDLKGLESSEASSNLRLLMDVIGTLAPVG